MPTGVTVQQAVRQRFLQFHRDLDQICEQAAQEGHGVHVIWSEGLAYEMRIDPDVPFGQILETMP